MPTVGLGKVSDIELKPAEACPNQGRLRDSIGPYGEMKYPTTKF